MRCLPLAAFGGVPTFDDHLDNPLLLGTGVLIIIFALIAGAIIVDGFTKAFESSADRLEHKSIKRRHKRRRTTFRQHQRPPLRVIKSDSAQAANSPAHKALRRNAQASIQHADVAPATFCRNIRVVK